MIFKDDVFHHMITAHALHPNIIAYVLVDNVAVFVVTCEACVSFIIGGMSCPIRLQGRILVLHVCFVAVTQHVEMYQQVHREYI